jgi:hypothetical protein
MTPKAAAAAELIKTAELVPAALHKVARAHEARLETLGALHERLAVWMLEKKAAAIKTAAAEGLGPAQDAQNAAPVAPQREKTLQELMGTPDIQKWFQGSVRGLAKRGNIPYALLSPDQEPQTNMEREQLKAILQKMLAAKG